MLMKLQYIIKRATAQLSLVVKCLLIIAQTDNKDSNYFFYIWKPFSLLKY